MAGTYRNSDDFYMWYIYGTYTHTFQWGEFFSGGDQFANQWLTLTRIGYNEPGQLPYLDLSSSTADLDGDIRLQDRITFDFEGTQRASVKNVEYVDSTLDTVTHLKTYGHYGFASDASLESVYANVGNHHMTFTTSIKDNSLHLGSGWDSVTLIDHFDVPGEQYWSLIRRSGNQLDAYSLLTGRRIRMEDGQESINGDPSNKNFGEVELVNLKESWNNDFNKKYVPGQDIAGSGTRATFENIDLRSDGETFSDSFNLAYFNFIRYTSDNVWVGEATIHDGTDHSTPSDRSVTTGKSVYLNSGYDYDAPILDGQLSVIGQSRNGTHDLIVAEQDPGQALDGKLRLYTFEVSSGLYNEFNQVYLGTSANETADKSTIGGSDWSDRVALYGFGGEDVLKGGAGRDYLFGGQSTYNQLNSGEIGNQITGGLGADYFGVGNKDEFGAIAGANSSIPDPTTGNSFHQGYATDVIMDWRAQDATTPHEEADTLVVLSNGVAIIGGLRDSVGQVGLDIANKIDLRDYTAVATSDQDFDGARGGDDWDDTQDLDYIYTYQSIRDSNSIANEADRTVVNDGLIVARGLEGDDTLIGSTGYDYLYGNSGANVIVVNSNDANVNALQGGDRIYFDTRSGKQYVKNFTTGTDQFFLAKNVVDAFTGGQRSPADKSFDAVDTTAGGLFNYYTPGEGYDQNVTFIHSPIYKGMLSGIYGAGPYSNEEYYRTDFFADTATTAAGTAMNALAKSLAAIPIVGTALSIPFFALGAVFKAAEGFSNDWNPLSLVPFPDNELDISEDLFATDYQSIQGDQYKIPGFDIFGSTAHLNAVYSAYTDFTDSYVHVLKSTASVGDNDGNTTIASEISTGADNLAFLDFFEGAYTNDGFIPVLELNPGVNDSDPIYGYFAVHSNNETFVYLIISDDNLIENSEAVLVAEIEGILTADDFAVYDSNRDIYNKGADEQVVIVTPEILSVKDSSSQIIPDKSRTLDDTLTVEVKITGDVADGTVVKIYDANDVGQDGLPREVGTTTVQAANLGDLVTDPIILIQDTRELGQQIVQTDLDVPSTSSLTADGDFDITEGDDVSGFDGSPRDLSESNSFEYLDSKSMYYAVVENDIGSGIVIETRSNTYEVRAGGLLSTLSVDGGSQPSGGMDTLFLSATSAHLNEALDNQIENIEAIRVKQPLPPTLALEIAINDNSALTGEVIGIEILDGGADFEDGIYDLDISGGNGGATGWQVEVVNGRVDHVETVGSAGDGYSANDLITADWVGRPVLIDLRDQSEGFDVQGSSGGDTIYGAQGDDTITGFDGDNLIDLVAGGSDQVFYFYRDENLGVDDKADTIINFVSTDDEIYVAPSEGGSSGFDDRDGVPTRLMYETSTLSDNSAVSSATELLVVSNAVVSSAGDLTNNIAAAIDSAFDVDSLDGRSPSPDTGEETDANSTASSVLFAVESDVAGEWWIGRYEDPAGQADGSVSGDNIEVFARLTTDNILDSFWLPTVQAPQDLDLILPADTGPTESSGTLYTSNTSFSVGGLQSGNSIYYSLNGGSWETAPADQTTISLSEGTYNSIRVRQVDPEGSDENYSPISEITQSTRTVVIDTTAPTNAGTNVVGVQGENTITKDAYVRLSFNDANPVEFTSFYLGVQDINESFYSYNGSSGTVDFNSNRGGVWQIGQGNNYAELKLVDNDGLENTSGIDISVNFQATVTDLAGNSTILSYSASFDA